MVNYYSPVLNHACPACSGSQIEPVIDFGNFPYSCGCSPEVENLRYTFQIGYCTHCGMIQQIHFPDPEILYSVTNHDGVGDVWSGHYSAFADFIAQDLNRPARLLEIGGGRGEIAKKLCGNSHVKEIVINDYKYRGETGEKITVIEGGFEECEFNGKFDVIFSSHVFEHIGNFANHFEHCTNLLADNGAIYIAVPDFETWIDGGYLNAFVQEHNIYPTLPDIKRLLESNGFDVEGTDRYSNHSVYVKARKRIALDKSQSPNTDVPRERLEKYEKMLETLIEGYVEKLGDEEFRIFGAHIFAQILLFRGLNKSNCKGVYDNSPFKQGKYLYGTDIACESPIGVKDLPSGYPIIVNAGAYTNEIRKQLLETGKNLRIL